LEDSAAAAADLFTAPLGDHVVIAAAAAAGDDDDDAEAAL